MKNSESEPNNIDTAVNTVLRKQELGQLQSGRRNSLASRLRERITDLKNLNSDVSAATIASELTQAGCKISASTVQRVLREDPTKRKKSTLKVTHTQNTNAPSAITPTKNATDAEALLKRMQEEDGQSPKTAETKRTAEFKQ